MQNAKCKMQNAKCKMQNANDGNSIRPINQKKIMLRKSNSLAQKKPPDLAVGGFGLDAWQCPTFAWGSTLSSALGGFTSEVGMGSGGARPPWPPGDSVAAPAAFRRGAPRGLLGPPPCCPGQCALRFGRPCRPSLRLICFPAASFSRVSPASLSSIVFILPSLAGECVPVSKLVSVSEAAAPRAGRLGVVWPSLAGN